METRLYPEYPILLVDDEKHALRSYELALQSADMNNVISCGNGEDARKIVKDRDIELIILDMMMPGISGEELLEEFSNDYPEIPIIMVTCNNSLETAVECMQRGAADFMVKPIDIQKLLDKIRNCLQLKEMVRSDRLLRDSLRLKKTTEFSSSFDHIVTDDEEMYDIFNYCTALASTRKPILITGETGVGKELIAKALHEESDCTGRLITVNIAGLDDNMISDTLFGHTKGAFTGATTERPGIIEKANDGTLFIDEIGDLNLPSQVKLLRLLQEREYMPLGADKVKKTNARILLATHRNLKGLQRDKEFRKDLYYRISTHHICIPPLRERKGDIALLLDRFIKQAADQLGKKAPQYPPELVTLLKSYHFPGNVRELEAMVDDAVSRHTSKMLSTRVFADRIKRNSEDPDASCGACENLECCLQNLPFLPNFKEADLALVKEAMRRAENNQSIAAKLLGVTPQALSSRLKKMNLK